mgnify:CR=1 FL=1
MSSDGSVFGEEVPWYENFDLNNCAHEYMTFPAMVFTQVTLFGVIDVIGNQCLETAQFVAAALSVLMFKIAMHMLVTTPAFYDFARAWLAVWVYENNWWESLRAEY